MAVLVVASGVALAVSSTRGTGGPPPSAAPTTQPGRAGSPATSTTSAPSTPGAPPHISSLTPASASPGQTITATGSNFLSSNGSIVASFNGQVTATSCSSEDVCTVTVPPAPAGATSAHVTITTSSGISNAIAFSYP
ncbi:MAG TPA: IPT/TIG domain-containing protein [Acidimicrobiales bacterium]|nr:IPT/TIG domain-containing protein [Acidimicrobiales bacterium]